MPAFMTSSRRSFRLLAGTRRNLRRNRRGLVDESTRPLIAARAWATRTGNDATPHLSRRSIMSNGFDFYEGTASENTNPRITVRKGGQLVLTSGAVEMLGNDVEFVELAYNARLMRCRASRSRKALWRLSMPLDPPNPRNLARQEIPVNRRWRRPGAKPPLRRFSGDTPSEPGHPADKGTIIEGRAIPGGGGCCPKASTQGGRSRGNGANASEGEKVPSGNWMFLSPARKRSAASRCFATTQAYAPRIAWRTSLRRAWKSGAGERSSFCGRY